MRLKSAFFLWYGTNVGKGENDGNLRFLLFPQYFQYFQKASYLGSLTVGLEQLRHCGNRRK